MRGDIVYRVQGQHEARANDFHLGTFRSRAEAEMEIVELRKRELNGRNWAEQYHNRGFVIEEIVVTTDFEIPSTPRPREKYFVRSSPKKNPGAWDSTIVEVHRRTDESGGSEKRCAYERNHALFRTFEPFRQGNREFALISRDYTKTAVLDLENGNVIAEEVDVAGAKPGHGFCPVGFYVPDWWDVHDGRVIPGSEFWNEDEEWPNGEFGFVWGCYWGEDSSWKVQYLDLSRVREGVIRRDDRFGYVELETARYESPCLSPNPPSSAMSASPHFIRVSKHGGAATVRFAVQMKFGLESGKAEEWERTTIAEFE